MYCGFSLKSFGQQAKLQLFNDPAPTFIVNLSDSHSDPAISLHSLILLSQFFFPPCSFTLSASLSLAGERQSAPGRWGGGEWRGRKWGGCRQSLSTERRDEEREMEKRERRVK